MYNWARKAQTGGFQLIPLPADPFALPYTLKSDPLRGPVFVPLNLKCLLAKEHNCLFHGNKINFSIRKKHFNFIVKKLNFPYIKNLFTI